MSRYRGKSSNVSNIWAPQTLLIYLVLESVGQEEQTHAMYNSSIQWKKFIWLI